MSASFRECGYFNLFFVWPKERRRAFWVNYAVIFDVVLLPEYQGQGLGKRIMKYLAERAKARNVLLHAVPGKEKFYETLGYRRMKTAMGLFAEPETKRQQGYIE